MKNIDLLIAEYKKTKTEKSWYLKSVKEMEAQGNLVELIIKSGLKNDNNILKVATHKLDNDKYIQNLVYAIGLVKENRYKEIELILKNKTTKDSLELQASVLLMMEYRRVSHSFNMFISLIDNKYHEIHNTVLSALNIYYRKELLLNKTHHKEIVDRLINLINTDYPEGTNFIFDCRIDAIDLLGVFANIEDIEAIELLKGITKKGVSFKSFWHRYKRNYVDGKISSKEALEKILKRKPNN